MENMRRNLEVFVRLRREYEENVHKEESRERLSHSAVSKIRTTMIGALAAMEVAFGDKWGQGKPLSELSPEELKNYKIKEAMRKKIFDLGNKNIRNLSNEIEHYDITWNKYNITFGKGE